MIPVVDSRFLLRRITILYCWSIIEGDQNQVAAFSLEYFSNLTRSALAYENASNHGAKAGRLIKTNHTRSHRPRLSESNLRNTQEKNQPLDSGHPQWFFNYLICYKVITWTFKSVEGPSDKLRYRNINE